MNSLISEEYDLPSAISKCRQGLRGVYHGTLVREDVIHKIQF